MIKIILTDPLNTEKLHFKHLKPIVLGRLTLQKTQAKGDSRLVNLLTYIESNLRKILIGKREDLEEIITKVEKDYYISINKFTEIDGKRRGKVDGRNKLTFPSKMKEFLKESLFYEHLDTKEPSTAGEYKQELKELKVRYESYGEVLEKIFDYDNFTKEGKVWSGYVLADHLNVGVCPYCNRTFTTTLKKVDGKGNQTRPDFDHYYPKSRYQYLGLSLYNLIPSCGVCNRSLKKSVDFYNNEAIHPYEEEFLEVASFSTNFDYTKDESYRFLLGDTTNFEITFKVETDDEDQRKRVEKSIKTFSLLELYNSHKDIVVEIIKLSRISTEERFEELYKQVGYLFKDKEEFTRTFFSNYTTSENLGKRPLAKLTQDISKELSLSLQNSNNK
ncbi:hypothetical protein P4679_23945 [Priestia megaterium]|uniref:HNH endonuclease n=1 Tax=Priestia megaterium TaxID=1404 RepID=UPI002E1DFA0C|nr:hypothetical protein [Priestia megaterium]